MVRDQSANQSSQSPPKFFEVSLYLSEPVSPTLISSRHNTPTRPSPSCPFPSCSSVTLELGTSETDIAGPYEEPLSKGACSESVMPDRPERTVVLQKTISTFSRYVSTRTEDAQAFQGNHHEATIKSMVCVKKDNLQERLNNGEQRENEEGEGGPVDEFAAGLVNDYCVGGRISYPIHPRLPILFNGGLTNRKQSPSDRRSTRSIPFLARKGISSSCSLQKYKCQKYKHLCPDPCFVRVGVHPECLEGAQDDEDDCPSVPEREG